MLNHKTQLIFALIFSCLILFGLYLTSRIDLAFSSDLEKLSGPRAYPAMILGSMLVFNTLIVLRTAVALARSQGPDPDTVSMFNRHCFPAAILFGCLFLFCVTFEPVGYILSMIPLLIVTSRLNGARNWLVMILVSVLLAFVCLLIFRYALNTVLPEGIFGIDGIV